MKKLVPIFLLLVSCNGKEYESIEQENILENLTISVDTVIIDSGKGLIDLSRDLGSYDLSNDKNLLYKWDHTRNLLQLIDLNSQELVENLPFEPEGPNGVGTTVVELIALSDGNFAFNGYNSFGVFDPIGQKIKDLSINDSIILSKQVESLEYNLILSKDQMALFSLPGKWMEGPRKLARINPTDKTIKIWNLPEFNWISEVKAKDISDPGGYFYETLSLKESGPNLFIHSRAESSLYYYNLEKKELFFKSFDIKLTPLRKDNSLQKEYDNADKFVSEVQKYFEGVNYGAPIWDGKRNLYFRFASYTHPKLDNQEISKKDIFLSVYDQKLNLIGETIISSVTIQPEYPFFKDGKLWSYVNVNDELGFAVFTFDF